MGSALPADTEALDTPNSVYRDWFWYRYVGVTSWSNRNPKTEVAGSLRVPARISPHKSKLDRLSADPGSGLASGAEHLAPYIGRSHWQQRAVQL
jgi:hypothetical protein